MPHETEAFARAVREVIGRYVTARKVEALRLELIRACLLHRDGSRLTRSGRRSRRSTARPRDLAGKLEVVRVECEKCPALTTVSTFRATAV
jgi:hypothetical protein